MLGLDSMRAGGSSQPWLKLPAVLAGLLLLAAGCTSPASNGPEQSIVPETAYPLFIDSEVMTLSIAVAAEAEKSFDPAALVELDDFLDDFVERGHGSLDIAVPLGEGGTEGLMMRTEAIVTYALARGVLRSALSIHAKGGEQEDEAVDLSYERITLGRPKCGDIWPSTSYNPRNVAHYNWGCAHQSNLALMAADGADLAGAAAFSPRDTARSSKVIKDYRAAKSTLSDYTIDISVGGVGQ